MATYIYCSKRSAGALDLMRVLGYSRLRKFDGLDFWDGSKRFSLGKGDVVVCWGAHLGELDGVRVLNGADFPENELKLYGALSAGGIYTYSTYMPNVVNWKKAPNKY